MYMQSSRTGQTYIILVLAARGIHYHDNNNDNDNSTIYKLQYREIQCDTDYYYYFYSLPATTEVIETVSGTVAETEPDVAVSPEGRQSQGRAVADDRRPVPALVPALVPAPVADRLVARGDGGQDSRRAVVAQGRGDRQTKSTTCGRKNINYICIL